MGARRRYAAHFDQRMNEQNLERLMSEREPVSLTSEEVELDCQPLTRTPKPESVRAWVRYGDTAVKVDGIAVAWTPRAVAVTWKTPGGGDHGAWLWACAVE
jgi:hypothetical protein